MRAGKSLLALKNNIKKHGLHKPIVADFAGVIYQGRSRYMACKEAGVELLVHQMSTKEAKQHAMSHRVQRFDTVFDRVRFVKWVQQEIQNQKPKGNLRKNISQRLLNFWGWTTGSSVGQVQKYQEIITLWGETKNKVKIETLLRKAAHLHEAWGNLFPEKGSKASTKSQPGQAKKSASKPDLLGKLKSALKAIGTDLSTDN